MRRTDAFGLLGLLMLLAGVSLYLSGSVNRMSWWYWLGGPALWYAGFALLVGWGLVRCFRMAGGEEPRSRPPRTGTDSAPLSKER